MTITSIPEPEVLLMSLVNCWSIMVCPKASPHTDCQLLLLLAVEGKRCISSGLPSLLAFALAVTCCSSLAPCFSQPLVSLSVALYSQFQLLSSIELWASGLRPCEYSWLMRLNLSSKQGSESWCPFHKSFLSHQSCKHSKTQRAQELRQRQYQCQYSVAAGTKQTNPK